MKISLICLALCVTGSILAATGPLDVMADAGGLEGVVHPRRVVLVGSATSGLLRSVSVERGDRVQVGQVVAKLDASVLSAQAALAQARAEGSAAREIVVVRLADAQRRLAQKQNLQADGIAPVEAVDVIRTEVQLEQLALAQEDQSIRVRELELRKARALLAQATIVSPVAGVVTERHLSPGELLGTSGSDIVITIAEIDPLMIDVHVPIELFDEITVGLRTKVQLDLAGGERRSAIVSVKDHVIDSASRTFRVQLELPNPEGELPAGMRCRVLFGK
jgi:membrane fusion protein (multidrug efflux system)